jgi:hypothetical protein
MPRYPLFTESDEESRKREEKMEFLLELARQF